MPLALKFFTFAPLSNFVESLNPVFCTLEILQIGEGLGCCVCVCVCVCVCKCEGSLREEGFYSGTSETPPVGRMFDNIRDPKTWWQKGEVRELLPSWSGP